MYFSAQSTEVPKGNQKYVPLETHLEFHGKTSEEATVTKSTTVT